MEFIRKAQNLKKGLPCLGKRFAERCRRFCAVLLCASMVLSGFPSTFFRAFASDGSEEYCYELERESLCEALLTAVSDGSVLSRELDFKGEYAEQYNELFDADGTLYELKDIDIEKDRERDKILDLRVFARIEGDVPLDAEYEINGSETVLFLLTSRSKDAVSAVIRIDDLETGSIEIVPASSVSREKGPGSAAAAEDKAQTSGAAAGSGASAGGNTSIAGTTANVEAGGTVDADNSEESESTEAGYMESFESVEPSLSESDAAGEVGPEDGSLKTDEKVAENTPSEDTSSTDTGASQDAGDERSENSDNEQADDSRDEHSDDSGNKDDSDSRSDPASESSDMAAVSAHRVGLLTSSFTGIVIAQESDTEEAVIAADDESYITDIDVVIADGSESVAADDNKTLSAEDNDVTFDDDTQLVIASSSDVQLSDDESSTTDGETSPADTVSGELYDAVLLDARKAAVAFVTTTEDLGMDKYSNLEEQTIQAKIYNDSSYDMRLADGTTITLTGMMPMDAGVKAYPVEIEIEDIHVLAAYDITIFDRNGKEFQPKDDVIEVQIKNDAIYEALDYEHELTVYHMEDEFDEPEEIATILPAPRRLQILSFPAERFSIYIVGDGNLSDKDGDYAVYTVNFYEYVYDAGAGFSDQEKLVDTQRVPVSHEYDGVLGGDGHLNEPVVPEILHHIFDGWFTEKQGTDYHYGDNYPGYKFDFSLTVQKNLESWDDYTVGEDDLVISLYSDYDPIYYVYYMTQEEDDKGNPLETGIFWTDEYHENNSELDTATAESLYQSHTSASKAVTDWYYYEDDENKSKDTIHYISDESDNGGFHITEDMILYPVVTDVIWIYFTMGEDPGEDVQAVDPIYGHSGQAIGILPDAQRAGYTFEGWYYQIEDEYGNISDRQMTASDDPQTVLDAINGNLGSEDEGYTEWIDLYAHWAEAPVGYTINIWRQKATDGATGVNQKTVRTGETYDDYIGYYDFAESIHIDATANGLKTGDTPTSGTVSGWAAYTGYGNINNTGSAYYGFEYNQSRTLNNLATIRMASDSSTIINIFYDRRTITWTFQTGSTSSSRRTLIGLYGTNCAQGDDKYGDLNDWPNPGDYGNYNRWEHGSTDMTFETTFVILDSSVSVTFTRASVSAGGNGYYYLEITNVNQLNPEKEAEAQSLGIPYTRQVNDTWYRYERYITRSTGNFNITDKYTGYRVVGYTLVRNKYEDTAKTYTSASEGVSIPAKITEQSGFFSHNYNADFYLFHNAREYTITLESNGVNIGFNANGDPIDGGSDPTYTFKYGQDLTTTIFPEELDPEIFGPNSYSQFTGRWYEDPECDALFDKPDSMPANNLAAYANWELDEYEVTFISYVESELYQILLKIYADGEDPDQEIIRINSNGDPDDDGNPVWSYTITVRAGDQLDYDLDNGVMAVSSDEHNYEFGGWLNVGVEPNRIFNFKSYIYDDTWLQVFWIENGISYHLLYYPVERDECDDETEPVLGHAHELDSYAEVREYINLFEELPDKDFLYWVGYGHDAEGKEFETYYYPGSEIDFSKIEVEAVYKDDESGDVDYYIYRLYPYWATEDEATLILDYNYPDGYESRDKDGNPDDENHTQHPRTFITQETLSDIDLGGTYIDEETEKEIPYDPNTGFITATVNGETTCYWFAGWSRDEAVTEDSIIIPADAIVAVNENRDGTDNILYAVWSEIEPPQKEINEVTNSDSEPYPDRSDGDPVNAGDHITYKITYTNYTDKPAAVTIVDVLDDNVTFVSATPEGAYEQSTDDDGNTVIIWTIEDVEAGDTGAVTLTVQVNESALSEGSISNTASAKVNNDPAIDSDPVNTDVGTKTYDVQIFKYDPDLNLPGQDSADAVAYLGLEGAQFILSRSIYDDDSKTGDEYAVVEKNDDGSGDYTYTITKWTKERAKAVSLISDENGYIEITDLETGTYMLTETKAPDGYLLLTEQIEFVLNKDGSINITNSTDMATVDDENPERILVKNTAGRELPGTGGHGTLPFTLMGLLMMGGPALIYLALRRRKVRVG